MNSLLQDLRYGARMLLKKPGFALIAMITLALGIGANTAIFSVVYALLLRPLPYREPERLVVLSEKPHAGQPGQRWTISYLNFSDWRQRAQSFEGMAAVRWSGFNLTGLDRPAQLNARMVHWNFFQLLGVQPQLGRLFVAEDDRYGAPRTVIISNGMWKERFGGDASIIGRKLLLDAQPYEVVGVLQPGFEYFRADDVFTPISLFLDPRSVLLDRGSQSYLFAVARLKPGVTVEQASNEMAMIAGHLEREYPAVNSGRSAQAEPLQDVMSESVRQSLWVLLGAVGFILLIACVNVANLLLAHAADRQKEIALRLALGARRWHIVRQLLSEATLIAALGGTAGLLAGSWMLKGLLALAPDGIPQLNRVGMNYTVLFFTLAVAALTSLLCGLAPALSASRVDLNAALKEGSPAAGVSRERIRKTLLVVEVSLALVLLVGAGLLVRSMVRVLNVDPGFDPENLLTMRLQLAGQAYNDQRRRAFHDECLARVGALPGVRAAAITLSLPIDGSWWNSVFIAADKPVPPRPELPSSAYTPVSANYFDAMGIRLLKGRAFTSADTQNSAMVIVVNETLARRIWPDENPIGKRLKQGWPESQGPWREVVGVVADIKLNGLERDTPMQTYLPITQIPIGSVGLVVRTAGDPLLLANAVEGTIHSIDKDLPVSAIRSMEQLLGISMAQRRLTMTLLMSFAALALLLAGVGIYGVIAYSVRQRTRELGIRMALGAKRHDVLRLILTQGLKLALIGVSIGLLAAIALTRWMKSMLFNVDPIDSFTFATIPVVLLIVALFACWIPARRATKVDPMVALRYE
jgi:predicted permease